MTKESPYASDYVSEWENIGRPKPQGFNIKFKIEGEFGESKDLVFNMLGDAGLDRAKVNLKPLSLKEYEEFLANDRPDRGVLVFMATTKRT